MAHHRSPAACSSRRLSALMAAVVLLLAAAAPASVAAARLLTEAPVDDSFSSMAAEQPAEGTVLTIVPASADYSPDDAGTVDLLDRVVHAMGTPAPPPPTLPPPPPKLDAGQPVPSTDQVLLNTLNCSGFAQPRTYIEGQAWFTPELPDVPQATAIETRSMHLHIGACVPHRQWVAGVIRLGILVQRHAYNMPDDTAVSLKVELEQTTSTGTTVRMTTYGQLKGAAGWTCENAVDLARLCKQVFWMDVQSSTADATAMEGLNILRMVGSAPINDTVTTRFIETRIVSNVVLWNNQAVQPAYPTGLSKVLPPSQLSTTGFPWAYTHAEDLDEIALKPYVGNMSIKAASFSKTNTANVTGLFISIDPVFHQTPIVPGKVVRNYTRDQFPNAECPVTMNGNVSHIECGKIATIPFDTRQLDDKKWHKLFLRTDSFVSNSDPLLTTKVPRVGGGTFSAVALIAFRVNNTGNVIGASVPANATSGNVLAPPPGFTPPGGVIVFDGNQPLPDTSATLNVAANGFNCNGWLEPRAYLEGGALFTQTYQSLDYGNGSQLIIGACLPQGQRVAGKVPVDILLQKRNFPADSGLNIKLLVQLDWSSGNITYRLNNASSLTNWTCATPNNCRSIISIQVDTKPASGLYIAPDGPNALTLEASTSFNTGTGGVLPLLARLHSWVFVTNNRDADTTIPLNTTGATRLEYPWGKGTFMANLTTLPPLFTPASGLVPVAFSLGAPVNITNMVLAIDPLAGPTPLQGLLLANGSRWTNKTLCWGYTGCKLALNINSTKLCNGVHRLALRSDSFVQSTPALAQYGSGTFSTYDMATFTVGNAANALGCIADTAPTGFKTASGVRAASIGDSVHTAAAIRLRRAYRLAPERVVMQAAPRAVQELEVVAYNP